RFISPRRRRDRGGCAEILLPAWAAATSTTRRVTESRRCRRIRVFARARHLLARNHHVAFLQIAVDNFSRRSVAQAHGDSAALGFAILAQHPDNSHLTR